MSLVWAKALRVGSQKINPVPPRSSGGYTWKKKDYFTFSSRRILHQTAETYCPEHGNSFLAASTELPRDSSQLRLQFLKLKSFFHNEK